MNSSVNPATVQVDAMVSVSRKMDSAILAKYGSDPVFIAVANKARCLCTGHVFFLFCGKCEYFNQQDIWVWFYMQILKAHLTDLRYADDVPLTITSVRYREAA